MMFNCQKKNSEKFLKSSCKINLSEYNKSIDSKARQKKFKKYAHIKKQLHIIKYKG